jgi:PAS domain S-box-containing protein
MSSPAKREDDYAARSEGISVPEGSTLESLLRLLVDTVRDYAIFVLDPTGHVITWNPGAARLKGYTSEEVVGRHFSIFYPEEDIAAGKPGWELEIAEQDGRIEDEGWRVRKDGSLFWANVIITALRDPDGRLVGFAKVTRDLTERRSAELRAIENARRLAEVEAANRAKSEFLAAMSHELRTPLNAIGGYVDLLLLGVRGPLTENQREDLMRVRRSQQHLLAIINDLLNFSRLEAGRVSYDIAPVQVASLVDEVCTMIEPQAAEAGIELSWRQCRDAVALADRAKVGQILLNLLTNAIKFTPQGGTIRVSCMRQSSSSVRIRVADSGIGIAEDQLESIFEPFVQVGRSLSSSHEGTGLGLAISRDLARGMNGDLTVQSAPGDGATFTISLPAHEAADETARTTRSGDG